MPQTTVLSWDSMTIQEILLLALRDEEEARDYYTRAATQATDPHVRATLAGLAAMEQGHADTLRAELEALDAQRACEEGIAD